MSELERRLRRWRWSRWRALWSEGGTRFAALLAGYLLIIVFADRFLTLRQDWRWGFFWIGAAAFIFGAWNHLISPLRALGASSLLRAVSDRYPELKEYLLSAWELGNSSEIPVGTSQALADEHLAQTESLLRGSMFSNPFPWAPSKQARKRLFSVAACWAVGVPVLGTGNPHFQRVLAPWLDVRLEERLDVKPGDQRVPWGEEVEITAAWKASALARPPALWARSGEEPWGKVEWERRDGNTFYFTIPSLTAVFEYRFQDEGIRTRSFKLTPIPAPRLVDLHARVHVPGAGPSVRELKLEGSGRIAALRRSWVVLRGRESRPLSKATLEISFLGQPVVMRRKGGGFWEAGFPLNEDGRMRVLVSAEDQAAESEPVSYTLRALEDEPPHVELLSPAFALEISRKEILPIAYEAEDDYGLSQIALVYSIGGREGETVIPLERFRKRPTEFLGDYNWDLSGFPIGGLVEFRIRGTDNARPDSQTSVSSKGMLRIVDFESSHAKTALSWLGAEASLKRLAEREAEMQEFLKELAKAEAGDPEAKARLAEAENSLDAQWNETLQRMSSFSESMEKDAYANPGMTETAKAMKQALEGMRQGEREEARKAAVQGRNQEARERHASLERKVKRTGEMLNQGRELQAMQDFWGEAQRMEHQGKEISNALDKLAAKAKQGKAPTSEQKRALDKAMADLRNKLAEMQSAISKLPETEEGSERGERRKVYKVPLLGAKDKMDALQQAIERGDYEEAARIAKSLAKQLERVHEAIAKAAQDQASGGSNAPSQRMEKIASKLEDAVKEQQKGLGMTDALERKKLEARMQEQKRLLRELAVKQRAALKDAALAGRAMPLDALSWMRQTLEEFQAEKIEKAPQHLGQTVSRLQGRARAVGVTEAYKPLLDAVKTLALPWERFRDKAGKPTTDGDRLAAIALQEIEILEALKQGSKQPSMGEQQLSQSFAANAVQKSASRKTETVKREMDALSEDFGMMPGKTQKSLTQARTEQGKAEQALKEGNTSGARGHQQKALQHMSDGKKSLQESMKQQQSISQGSSGPFQGQRGRARPMGRGGRTGSDTGFVPLPGAEDYQPPRRIREEVERSLREKRPRVFDNAVDEYLKRMSQ